MPWDSCQNYDISEISCGEFDDEDDYVCFRGTGAEDCEADSYKIGTNPIVCIIKNHFNESLAAEYKGPNDVDAVFVKTECDPKDQKTFLIEKFRTTNPGNWLSVAFTISVNEEQYYLCCTLDKKIIFKPGKCPTLIREDKSDVIFLARQFSIGHDAFKFESSLHKDYYLAIREESGKKILCLKRPTDVVDESAKFTIDVLNSNGTQS